MTLIHLDTDFGGDIDDLCALAMLLRWPGGVQISGITTVAENGGRRAGYVRYVLGLEGRAEIPVAAGADNAQGFYPYELGLPPEDRYYPEPAPPAPGPFENALELLKKSIEQGAVVIAIGPYTNLALLEERYPGILHRAKVVLMGGYVFPVGPGFPAWGNDMDFNVQIDTHSARRVLQSVRDITLTPLTVTVETALCHSDLDPLRRAGALGQLIARQAVEFAADNQNETNLRPTSPRLAEGFINFQHDPLACAVALGWEGARVETLPLEIEEAGGLLVERVEPSGKPVRVVTQVDSPAFNRFWLDVVTRNL